MPSENCITDGEYYLCACVCAGGGGGGGGGQFNFCTGITDILVDITATSRY